MRLCNVGFASAIIFLIVSLLTSPVLGEDAKTWARGFTWAGSKIGPAIVLTYLDQGESHLTGSLAYENYAAKDKTPAPVSIAGVKAAHGVFWPDVTLQVRNESTGKWRTIAKPINVGQRTTLRIEANNINSELMVNLDVFKSLIGKYESGRIVLNTGASCEFQLKYLLPP
jgi:hypothetical protein